MVRLRHHLVRLWVPLWISGGICACGGRASDNEQSGGTGGQEGEPGQGEPNPEPEIACPEAMPPNLTVFIESERAFLCSKANIAQKAGEDILFSKCNEVPGGKCACPIIYFVSPNYDFEYALQLESEFIKSGSVPLIQKSPATECFPGLLEDIIIRVDFSSETGFSDAGGASP